MNHEQKKQNCLKIAKFLSSRLFRGCMVGIVIVCLVIIAVPDHSYGEEATSQDTNVTDSLSDAADDMEDTDLENIDLEEISEEEHTQDSEDTSKEGDTQDLEEIQESKDEDSQKEKGKKKNKEISSSSKSKKTKTVSSPKASKTKTVSSSKKKQLDPIPQTGKNDVKAIAGLAGTIALGFYLCSKKLRQMYKKQSIKTRRFLS